MASCSKRFARVLADVRQDIDNFLDPAVLALVDKDAKADAVATQVAPASEPAAEELRLEVLGLRGEGDTLLAKLENARRDLKANRLEAERRASQDAGELARLQQLKSELEREARANRQRAQEAEREALQLRGEVDTLTGDLEGMRGHMEQTAAEGEAERRRLSEEAQRIREQMAAAHAQGAAPAQSAAAPAPGAGVGEGEDQTRRLQDEVASLRLILEQAAPERQLSESLRRRHAEYEEELRDLRASKAELTKLRSQSLRLEQEEAKLRAALEARSNALREAEELAQGATLAKRDLAAFVATATQIVADQRPEGTQAPPAGTIPTALELSLAWARLQGEVGNLRKQSVDCQQNLDQAMIRERHSQSESGQLRATLSTTQARLEERELDLRRARDESAALTARASVLRKAIANHNPGEVPASVQASAGAEEELRTQVELEKRRAKDFEAAAGAKQRAIDTLTGELNTLRQEYSRLSDMEVKNGQLLRSNEDLRRANRVLETDQERLAAEAEAAKREAAQLGAVTRDFDAATTKVLHFRHGPGAAFPSTGSGTDEALRNEVSTLREELRRLRVDAGGGSATATGDLECRQASRQLERFKKATKKYVQDFREGTYGLLGWKVEMKGEGNAMKWHLTSCYQEGEELVFQLRPGEPGCAAQFDLLATPWGEQLQADRQAMAYLEVYRSIPGFLAHITADVLSRHTIPG